MRVAEKRTVYYKNSLMKSSGDIKMLYKKLNRLLGNSAQHLPSNAINNPEGVSEDFKDFFGKKPVDIRLDIEEELKTSVSSTSNICDGNAPGISVQCRFGEFTALTLRELKDVIALISNKFCDLDPIPSFLLKRCVDELSPILLHAVK